MEEDLDDKNVSREKVDTSAGYILNLLSTSFLPKQNHSLDQPLEADAFKEHVNKCEDNFKKLLLALENDTDLISLNKKTVIDTLLLCGEHAGVELWTSCQTITYADQVLRLLLKKCNFESVLDLLLHYKISIVFTELKHKPLRNTWKENPAALVCFTWLLFHIKCPHLGEVLNCVLPTCLLLVDDHIYSNKIKGLQCLEHIANNVSCADLNQYGQGSVIYNALEHMIYLREPEIIPPLGACLTSLLRKTEHGLARHNLLWNHFDDVLNIWLPSMEMEQRLSLREAYIESLNSLLQAMGLASVRWSNKLLSILSEYTQHDHTRDKALRILLTFIQITWPRPSFQPVVLILMKIIIQISKNRTNNEKSFQSSLKVTKQCFSLLENICQQEYESFVNDLKNCSEMKEYVLLVTD